MFWSSVFNGLKVFMHWEIYVLGILYLIISWAPLIPVMFAKNEESAMAKSFWLMMFVQPLFIVFGTFLLVSSLFPIILGYGDDATWSLPWVLMFKSPLAVVILIVTMLIMFFISSLAPILGRSTSFVVLIIGGTALLFLLNIMNMGSPEIGLNGIDPIPGFLTIIGIVIFSAIASWFGILVAAVISTGLSLFHEGIGEALMIPICSIFGFIPVFIYGAWLGLQLNL